MAAQTILNKYFQDLERELKADGAYKASLMEKLRSDLEDFLEEHPEATEAQLRQYFGAPEDYAREYTATMDSRELHRSIVDRRFKRRLLVTVAGVFLAVVIGLAIWIGVRNSRSVVDFIEYNVVAENNASSQEIDL